MAQGVAEARFTTLQQRALSTLVLAPVAIGLTLAGGYAFAALVGVAAVLMALEWQRLCDAGGDRRVGTALAAVLLGAVVLAALGEAATAWTLIGTVLAATLILARRRGLWLAVGLVYVATPCLTVLWLRERPEIGLAGVIWLFAVVWIADTCAFLVGRAVGGPRLAPRISPKKTWAGLAGGLAGAAVVGVAMAWFTSGGGAATLAGLSMAIALVAQLGDLLESWLKRRAGVKDSGHLIPGHGGVLDRLDGLVTAAPVLALMALMAPEELPAWP